MRVADWRQFREQLPNPHITQTLIGEAPSCRVGGVQLISLPGINITNDNIILPGMVTGAIPTRLRRPSPSKKSANKAAPDHLPCLTPSG